MPSMSDIKASARRALHKRAAAAANYTSVDGLRTSPLTVRWHNRMQPALTIEQGGSGIVEGIEKIIFNATELAAPPDQGEPISLSRGDTVEIPGYSPQGSLFVTLDSEGATDGPENIYWYVTTNI